MCSSVMQRELTVAFPWQQWLRERAGIVSPCNPYLCCSLHLNAQTGFRVQPAIEGVPGIVCRRKTAAMWR
jgi:hypothetical protein